MQGKDFNHLTNDLYAEIGRRNYPKWDLYVKVLSPEALSKLDYNGLDATKVWLNVPDQVGTMTLNRLPENFFLDTAEQSAFFAFESNSWYRAIGRPFAARSFVCYADTALSLGEQAPFQLPVNRPLAPVVTITKNGLSNNAT